MVPILGRTPPASSMMTTYLQAATAPRAAFAACFHGAGNTLASTHPGATPRYSPEVKRRIAFFELMAARQAPALRVTPKHRPARLPSLKPSGVEGFVGSARAIRPWVAVPDFRPLASVALVKAAVAISSPLAQQPWPWPSPGAPVRNESRASDLSLSVF
jgi:hypothetical protein